MTPAQLVPASFAPYGLMANAFALAYLPLLRRLPLAVCPSFLQQVQALDTSFPAERDSLRWQCDALQSLPADQFSALVDPLAELVLPEALVTSDWVRSPASFVADLTAHLWSSGQMPRFRAAAHNLFAAIPSKQDTSHRLVVVMLGQGATPNERTLLRKLRRHGVFLTGLETSTAPSQIARALQSHAGKAAVPYGSWYVDGGVLLPEMHAAGIPETVVSYNGLTPIRTRVLARMQGTIASGTAGAEQMRSRLADTTAHDVRAEEVTPDPVLGRFYTELFTLSSGPQIFSTSFVQWTGRELARRVQPQTLLLRYAPRQQHHDLNELFARPDAGSPDTEASLRDAEMGAYLNWIEMSRISGQGRLTFAAVVEGHPFAVILGEGARPSSTSSAPMSFARALQTFG